MHVHRVCIPLLCFISLSNIGWLYTPSNTEGKTDRNRESCLDLQPIFNLNDVIAELEWIANKYHAYGLDTYGTRSTSLPVSYNVTDGSVIDYSPETFNVEELANMFLTVYELTSNQTYLTWAKDVLDDAWTYSLNSTTRLKGLYNTLSDALEPPDCFWHKNYIFLDQNDLILSFLWYYDITNDSLYLSRAEEMAKSLYIYAINKTSWLPFEVINPDGATSPCDKYASPYNVGETTYTFAKLHRATKNQTYLTWSLNLIKNFWSYRNVTTNLLPEKVDSDTGRILLDEAYFGHQGLFLKGVAEAYLISLDPILLKIMKNATEAYSEYGWNEELQRFIGLKTNGQVSSLSMNGWQNMEAVYGFYVASIIAENRLMRTRIERHVDTTYNVLRTSLGVFISASMPETHSQRYEGMFPWAHIVQNGVLYHLTGNQTYLERFLAIWENAKNNFKDTTIAPYGYWGSFRDIAPHHDASADIYVESANGVNWFMLFEEPRFTPQQVLARLKKPKFRAIDRMWVNTEPYPAYLKFLNYTKGQLTITLDAPSGTTSITQIYVASKGIFRTVWIDAQPYPNSVKDRSDFTEADYNCWYYDSANNMIYIKTVASYPVDILLCWRDLWLIVIITKLWSLVYTTANLIILIILAAVYLM